MSPAFSMVITTLGAFEPALSAGAGLSETGLSGADLSWAHAGVASNATMVSTSRRRIIETSRDVVLMAASLYTRVRMIGYATTRPHQEYCDHRSRRSRQDHAGGCNALAVRALPAERDRGRADHGLDGSGARERSEEHTSELQSQSNLVCRL